MSYVNNPPYFRGYLTNYTNPILQSGQFTSCYGVVNAPTHSPPITNCNIGPLAINMSLVCLANSNLILSVTLTNYEQATEPTRCNAGVPFSGYHGGPIGGNEWGSFSGESGSRTKGSFSGPCSIRTFEWDCDGPVIYKFLDTSNPTTYQDYWTSGGTVSVTGCASGCFDILVTE
jgi:hypothetical protein